ncbi:MAG: nucleoside deaminase [Clostridiales bacterium]|nr:nucleoside deaminase [Clostridiales bacterium]
MEPEVKWMKEALALARAAAAAGDVPVGCVVVRNGAVVGRGCNRREALGDATAHAEVEAIRDACAALGSWRLDGCVLYVTLEPCPMCAGAILNARIDTVVYGAASPKAGCCGSVLSLFQEGFNHRPAVYGGVLEEDCGRLLTSFFEEK